VEDDTKLFPVTVNVKAAPPAIADPGVNNVIADTAVVIVNVRAAEVPPPGEGLSTVTLAVLTALMSAAVMAACKLVLETNVVDRVLPFHWTVDVGMKFVPVTVNVKLAPPAPADVGFMDATVGEGLSTVKVSVLEVPPPGVGVETVTGTVPLVAMSALVICACSCVLDTKVVGRALPFQCTVESEIKFVPVTVNVKPAPPATAELGFKDVTVGEGLLTVLTVKVSALEVPPPGVGVETVTETVPLVAMSVLVICACSCVLDTKVVGRALPFQCTVESETKFVPLTVSVKLALPAGAALGLNDATVGTGLLEVGGLRPLQPAINPEMTTIAARQQTSRFIDMEQDPPGNVPTDRS